MGLSRNAAVKMQKEATMQSEDAIMTVTGSQMVEEI